MLVGNKSCGVRFIMFVVVHKHPSIIDAAYVHTTANHHVITPISVILIDTNFCVTEPSNGILMYFCCVLLFTVVYCLYSYLQLYTLVYCCVLLFTFTYCCTHLHNVTVDSKYSLICRNIFSKNNIMVD